MKKAILLLSSSNVHGYGYLEYNRDVIATFFEGLRTPLLFVPHAAGRHEWDNYTEKIRMFFATLNIPVSGIHTVDRKRIFSDHAAIFIGGGNTFRLLNTLQEEQLLSPIREAVLDGRMQYMGSSAGTNMACKSIRTTNDMPITYPKGGFEAMNLFTFQINPHYLDPEPESIHKGETRDQRIAEFHQENDTPVIGLREGAYLNIGRNFAHTGELYVGGKPGAKIFLQGRTPYEAPVGVPFTLNT